MCLLILFILFLKISCACSWCINFPKAVHLHVHGACSSDAHLPGNKTMRFDLIWYIQITRRAAISELEMRLITSPYRHQYTPVNTKDEFSFEEE